MDVSGGVILIKLIKQEDSHQVCVALSPMMKYWTDFKGESELSASVHHAQLPEYTIHDHMTT